VCVCTGQLEKALPSEMLARYEDRVAEESLNLADLGDLVKYVYCIPGYVKDTGPYADTGKKCVSD